MSRSGPDPRLDGPIPARAGIGLRSAHHDALLAERPDVGWVEVHTENYFHDGGAHVRALERARELYPLSLHGVGLGLGSVDPPDSAHLRRIRRAIDRFAPALVSDHACWEHLNGEHFNDLLPLPYTEEAVELLAARVRDAQDALGRQMLIENVSAYVSFGASSLSEAQFLAGVVERSGCALLLDVNNAYVNEVNLGSGAAAFLDALPVGAVREIHLAGHTRQDIGGRALLLDDHGSRVSPAVWDLYARAVSRFGPVPTLIEWDTRVPALEVLLAEAQRAQQLLEGRRELAA